MGPVADSFTLLVNVIFNLVMLLVLLRFLLQLVRADFYNPISQTVARLTNPLILPLRRVIPGYGGFDVASLVLLLLAEMLATVLLGLVHGVGLVPPLLVLLWSPLGIVNLFLSFYFFAILASIILSWVAPGNASPVTYLLHQLTEPVMAPFRRLLPAMGGLDLSPILVFIAIQIAQIFVSYAARGVNLQPALVVGF
ncbi:MAG: YggT family protein [Halieaceae bacterium]|jgi:YggT family protein|nr:YggT family protein [Halieaceae bacterium]